MLRKLASLLLIGGLAACGGTSGQQVVSQIGAGLVVTRAAENWVHVYTASPLDLAQVTEIGAFEVEPLSDGSELEMKLSPDAIARHALFSGGVYGGDYALRVFHLRDAEEIAYIDQEELEDEIFDRINKGIAFNQRKQLENLWLKDAWWASPSIVVAKIYAQSEGEAPRRTDFLLAFNIHDADGDELEILSEAEMRRGTADYPDGYAPMTHPRLAGDRLTIRKDGTLLVDGRKATGPVPPVLAVDGLLYLEP